MTTRALTILLIPAICLALSLPHEASAGDRLKLFEQSATSHTHAQSENQGSVDINATSMSVASSEDSSLCYALPELCATAIIATATVAALIYGGAGSLDYAAGSDLTDIASDGARDFGESVVPFLRLDVNRGYIPGNISAIDARAEAGFGPLAFEIQKTFYNENAPSHSLVITKKHGLFRMLFLPQIEADIGLGSVRIKGTETNTGHSFTARVLIYPIKDIGIEVRPVWYTINGNHTAEGDVSINAGLGYVMLRAGYHWMTTTREPLNGYFVGVSAVF
ncbi:MAG: hypothetical protein OEV59_01930 [Deltaproteobacteria bacterium]|nr:hypothetical protein [Deltaproteobacteria bacterium]